MEVWRPPCSLRNTIKAVWDPRISQEGACLIYPNTFRHRSGAAHERAGSGFQGLGTWLLKLGLSEVCKAPSQGATVVRQGNEKGSDHGTMDAF